MKPPPVPPASGGRCGAQIPAAFAFARSSSIRASDDSSSRAERGLVRIDVLLHERAHLRAAFANLRRERKLGHGRMIAYDGRRDRTRPHRGAATGGTRSRSLPAS